MPVVEKPFKRALRDRLDCLILVYGSSLRLKTKDDPNHFSRPKASADRRAQQPLPLHLNSLQSNKEAHAGFCLKNSSGALIHERAAFPGDGVSSCPGGNRTREPGGWIKRSGLSQRQRSGVDLSTPSSSKSHGARTPTRSGLTIRAASAQSTWW